jgi:GNAT superfamily N-acetyltransferase
LSSKRPNGLLAACEDTLTATAPRIGELGPGDWTILRDVRLAALRDAPYAFGSTLGQEAQMTPSRWRRRLADRTQFVAWLGDDVVGTAGGLVDSESEATTAELVSMWVRPRARGQGVGDGLVTAVLAWATQRGCDRVRLWVSEGNLEAERLYGRHGFQPTGSVQPVGADQPERLEFEMLRGLDRLE